MNRKVFVTGGYGFIGSYVVDRLIQEGDSVLVFDNLDPQVHGFEFTPPSYKNPNATYIFGDVQDQDALLSALSAGVTHIVHLAAKVGVGQSAYQAQEYTDVNSGGTAALLDVLTSTPEIRSSVRRLVVASSMSIYGEGLYYYIDNRDDGSRAKVKLAVNRRPLSQLKRKEWDCALPCFDPVRPTHTPESKEPDIASIYALTKYAQERSCLLAGEALGIPTLALRLFNTFGPRQALSNPYTGAVAIFATRLLNDLPPILFEDGRQSRDFVSVYDVSDAIVRSLDAPLTESMVLNIGSGTSVSVLALASLLAQVMGKDIAPIISGKYRVGDIRHCFADISVARRILQWEPQWDLMRALRDYVQWLKVQKIPESFTELHLTELESLNLVG